jgi:hypothetical protein
LAFSLRCGGKTDDFELGLTLYIFNTNWIRLIWKLNKQKISPQMKFRNF